MNIFKLIYEDIKNDLSVLKAMFQGKAKLKFNPKDITFDIWLDSMKTYWWVFMLIALAFVCGILMSSQYYESKCNEFIQEKYIPLLEQKHIKPETYTFNLTAFNQEGS